MPIFLIAAIAVLIAAIFLFKMIWRNAHKKSDKMRYNTEQKRPSGIEKNADVKHYYYLDGQLILPSSFGHSTVKDVLSRSQVKLRIDPDFSTLGGVALVPEDKRGFLMYQFRNDRLVEIMIGAEYPTDFLGIQSGEPEKVLTMLDYKPYAFPNEIRIWQREEMLTPSLTYWQKPDSCITVRRVGGLKELHYFRNTPENLIAIDLTLFLTETPASFEASDIPKRTQMLLAAAEAGDNPRVELMLATGLDVNSPYSGRRMMIEPGGTALMMATWKNKASTVKLLLSKGANVNVKDNYGYTALSHAYDPEIVSILINAGADVNERDKEGQTILIGKVSRYCSEGDPRVLETIKILIERGADVNAKDKRGHTPTKLAELSGKAELVQIFEQSGVRQS